MNLSWPRSALRVVAAACIAVAPPLTQQRDQPTVRQIGTATITGRVTTDEAVPRPVGRAMVSISTADLNDTSSVITDDEGRFTIGRLPAGRFMISAEKRGFVSGAFGASRPGRPGTPVILAAGERRTVSIVLTRGAVIAGTVRNEDGSPVPGLIVVALSSRTDLATLSPLLDARFAVGRPVAETDDRGAFRLYGLRAGEYVVVALARTSALGSIGERSTEDIDVLLARLQARQPATAVVAATSRRTDVPQELYALAPVYAPATPNFSDAARVMVAAGDERGAVDIVLIKVPATEIEGEVSGGGDLGTIQMGIVNEQALRLIDFVNPVPLPSQRPGRDGHFAFSNVIPGHYTITASANELTSNRVFYGVTEVDVRSGPVRGVAVRLVPGTRLGGRVVFDAATTSPPKDPTTVTVFATPINSTGTITMNGVVISGNVMMRPQQVKADEAGAFEFASLPPGTYTIRVAVSTSAPDTWWARTAIVDGRDVFDTRLTVAAGMADLSLVCTLTDRRNEITGRLETSTGLPAPEYFVVAFPADPALWRENSRRVKATRPATDGGFRFLELPAGEYLIAALTDVEPDEWQQPAFLAQVAPAGVKVSLGNGEKKIQNLRIAK